MARRPLCLPALRPSTRVASHAVRVSVSRLPQSFCLTVTERLEGEGGHHATQHNVIVAPESSHASPVPNKPFMWTQSTMKEEDGRQSWGGGSGLCEGNESHAVSVDVKHHGRRRRTTELGRWAWALIPYPTLPPSLISLVVSVDAKYHERRKRSSDWNYPTLAAWPASPYSPCAGAPPAKTVRL